MNDLVELKAQAYDTITMIEGYQRKLSQINNLIAKKVQDERGKAAGDSGSTEAKAEGSVEEEG